MTRLIPMVLLALALPFADGKPMPCLFDTVPAIMRRIARAEGFHRPGAIPRTHNNPGALVYRGQRGAVAGSHGELRGRLRFAKFRTEAEGWRALERDIRAKQRRGVPLSVGWRYL